MDGIEFDCHCISNGIPDRAGQLEMASLSHCQKIEFIYKTAVSFHYTGLKWTETDKAGLWAEIMGLNATEVNKQYSADVDHRDSMDSLNYRKNCG